MRNEALAELDGLVGEWTMTMTDSWFLESRDVKVHGEATIAWLGEAFLHLHATFEDDSTWDWVIGRSDAHEQLTVLYHDDRGVCRVFDMTFRDGEWSMLREDPDFHQRFVGTITLNRIEGRTDANLKTQSNGGSRGDTCSGDSGGPVFYPSTTNTIGLTGRSSHRLDRRGLGQLLEPVVA